MLDPSHLHFLKFKLESIVWRLTLYILMNTAQIEKIFQSSTDCGTFLQRNSIWVDTYDLRAWKNDNCFIITVYWTAFYHTILMRTCHFTFDHGMSFPISYYSFQINTRHYCPYRKKSGFITTDVLRSIPTTCIVPNIFENGRYLSLFTLFFFKFPQQGSSTSLQSN